MAYGLTASGARGMAIEATMDVRLSAGADSLVDAHSWADADLAGGDL